MRIAIITGVEEEASAFLVGQGAEEIQGPLTLRHLVHHGHDITITCCGIGKVNAASAATALAITLKPDMLMIIGTAGKIGALAGDCFVIRDAVQSDYGATRSGGFAHFTAGSWPIGDALFEPAIAYTLPDIGLPSARIATGDSFVECPDHGASLARHLVADLVDMETAAIAQVATKLGLPWAAIKATSDAANGDSSADFMANFRVAARRAADAAEQTLKLL